jgi:hypothetical protein
MRCRRPACSLSTRFVVIGRENHPAGPSYFLFQLKSVAWLIPALRQISETGTLSTPALREDGLCGYIALSQRSDTTYSWTALSLWRILRHLIHTIAGSNLISSVRESKGRPQPGRPIFVAGRGVVKLAAGHGKTAANEPTGCRAPMGGGIFNWVSGENPLKAVPHALRRHPSAFRQ